VPVRRHADCDRNKSIKLENAGFVMLPNGFNRRMGFYLPLPGRYGESAQPIKWIDRRSPLIASEKDEGVDGIGQWTGVHELHEALYQRQ